MSKIEYGIQMYSVRDIAETDLRLALEEVAKAGYKYIEFAGFFGHPAADVKKWLDEYGLTVIGTHTGTGALAPDVIDETIQYHLDIGCNKLIIPSANWKREENYNENIPFINEANEKLAKAGITLAYHNHSGEFQPTKYGKIIENELIEKTSIKLEIDTFWVFNAGVDPVEFCESIKDRITLIHLKDGYSYEVWDEEKGKMRTKVQGKSLGEGKAPVKAVREWALANGITMVVESENLDPNGVEEVRRCMSFLRSLED